MICGVARRAQLRWCGEHYRKKFAPRNFRASTFDVADGHLKKHSEPGKMSR